MVYGTRITSKKANFLEGRSVVASWDNNEQWPNDPIGWNIRLCLVLHSKIKKETYLKWSWRLGVWIKVDMANLLNV